ncbi:NPCBM/NEW2 domain-containing protein [Xylanimonas protaetiae]|uniref:NPCBM/NEW2 domain-containing protein n=1 Tax=Xylanimonas protaetiae TaxID=2509457 RepID=UPI001A931C0E|nr:NPCBM/NEW2 domain-containing protein [Xylanimonas protaetiae]
MLVSAGQSVRVRVTLHDDGTTPVRRPSLALALPEGWRSTVDTGPRMITPGTAATVDATVTVGADATTGPVLVSAEASFVPTGSRDVVTVPGAPSVLTVAPAPPTGAGVALSHEPWVSATSGWMQPAVDESVGGGNPLQVAGTVHATGLGVASPSAVRYHLGGVCTRLTGAVGIDDVVGSVGPDGGTSTFDVVGDGRTLWSSGVVTRGAASPFDLDVTGVRDLRLVVGDAGDGGYNDRADWLSLTTDCA